MNDQGDLRFMNRNLLKRIGDFLAMVILLFELPACSFLIPLDLTVRYIDCIVPKSLVLFLGRLFPFVMIFLILLVSLAYCLLLIKALSSLSQRKQYTLCWLLLSALLIKDVLYCVLCRLGILGIPPM